MTSGIKSLSGSTFAAPSHDILGASAVEVTGVDVVFAGDLDPLGVLPRPLGPDGGQVPAAGTALARGGPGLEVAAATAAAAAAAGFAVAAPRDGGAGEVPLEERPEPRQAVAHDA